MGSSPSHKDMFIPLNWANQGRPAAHRLGGKVPLWSPCMTIKSAGSDESHIRPGEVQVPLPAEPDASLYFIGRIRTPWTARKDCPKNARAARESGVVCTIEVDPRWHQALPGVETCSHLIVLYWMDRARRDLAVQVPKQYGDGKPTFSLRSPVRPNPIALAVVRASQGRGQHPSRRRRRLPRQHSAARHQALFRLDRLHPRRPRRLARRPEGRQQQVKLLVEGHPPPHEPFPPSPDSMRQVPTSRGGRHHFVSGTGTGSCFVDADG